MNSIVKEFSQRNSLLADILVIGWPIGVVVHSIPKAKVSATSSCIVSYGIVGVGDPKCSRGHIIIQKSSALLHKYCQVILKDIAMFNTIFNKKCSSLDIVYNIPLNQKVMCVMDGDSSVVGLVNSTASYIGFKMQISKQVPMYWISAQTESLARMVYLSSPESSHLVIHIDPVFAWFIFSCFKITSSFVSLLHLYLLYYSYLLFECSLIHNLSCFM